MFSTFACLFAEHVFYTEELAILACPFQTASSILCFVKFHLSVFNSLKVIHGRNEQHLIFLSARNLFYNTSKV